VCATFLVGFCDAEISVKEVVIAMVAIQSARFLVGFALSGYRVDIHLVHPSSLLDSASYLSCPTQKISPVSEDTFFLCLFLLGQFIAKSGCFIFHHIIKSKIKQ